MLTKTLAYAEGDVVAVRYAADPDLLHERLIVTVIGGDEVMTYTPDGDVYPLTLSVPPLVEILPRPRGGRYPRGRLVEVYRLEDGSSGVPTLEDFRELQRDHADEVREQRVALFGADERPRRRAQRAAWHDAQTGEELPGDGLPLGACFLGDRALYVGAAGEVRTATRGAAARGGTIVAAELPARQETAPLSKLYRDVKEAKALGTSDPEKLRRMGNVLSRAGAGSADVQDIAAELGCKDGKFDAAARPEDILNRLKELAGGDAAEEEDAEPEGADARTLAILRGPDGQRRRAFREAAGVLSESSWLDWPVEGPRTALWVVRFIAQHYESPVGRHSRFMADGRLTYGDVGCTQHQVGCQILHEAVTYDQLEVGQLAAFELLCRSLQLIELKHRDRFLPAGGAGGDPFEDTHLYLGLSQTRGLLMVSPALERYVGGELKDEFKAAEARRKAHEERQLRKPKK